MFSSGSQSHIKVAPATAIINLHHVEAAMSNNICERAIRNFTIGRKIPGGSLSQCLSLQHD